MREAIYLALGFFVTLFIASCVVPSLPYPLYYTPLITITGLLVLQRGIIGAGLAWLIIGNLLLATNHVSPQTLLPQLAATVIAAFFATRVFATRSVYALMGLGLLTGLVIGLVTLLIALFSLATGGFVASSGSIIWSFVLLQIGLYIGFMTSISLRNWAKRTFVVR
jgi:hypothetical protein